MTNNMIFFLPTLFYVFHHILRISPKESTRRAQNLEIHREAEKGFSSFKLESISFGFSSSIRSEKSAGFKNSSDRNSKSAAALLPAFATRAFVRPELSLRNVKYASRNPCTRRLDTSEVTRHATWLPSGVRDRRVQPRDSDTRRRWKRYDKNCPA